LPKLEGLSFYGNPVRHIPPEIVHARALEWFNIAATDISNDEYRAVRRKVNAKVDIPHDKIVFFEDEDKPCYTENREWKMPAESYRLNVDPYFMGKPGDWQNFLTANLKKEQMLKEAGDTAMGWQDSVVLKFMVRSKGGLTNINAVYFKSTAAKEEAVRLLKLSCPHWVPTMAGGRYVHAWFLQSFIFTGSKQGDIAVRPVTPYPAPPMRIVEFEEE
jgi:hypothetical protein